MSRVIYRAVLSALVILACAVSACADVSLFRGAENIGSVQTIEKASEIFVPVDDVAKLFGFKSSRSGEELVLTQGNSRIRVIENSAAAWRGLSIVPLYSAPFERNGKIWVDTQSAASLFQAFAGRGESNRLRFLSNTETLAGQVTPARKADTPRPAPAPVIAARPVNTPAPAAPEPEPQKTPETPETPALSVTASNTPEPAIAELPLSDDTERRLAARISRRARTQEKPKDEEKPEGEEKPEDEEKPEAPKPSTKKQPRIETFRPGYKRTEKGESYSGTIQKIRWNHSDGAYTKITAIVDADEEADPQVYLSGNELHALFAGCLNDAEGLDSPYANIKTQINSSDKGVELIFTLSDFTKAEKLVLNGPRRIDFEFFYPDTVSIIKANASDNEVASEDKTQTPEETPEDSSDVFELPDVDLPDVAMTPRRQSPAVKTLPSTITIPMVAGNAKSKTVVIDPGHGGKDPGASDNGVLEKDVNLAVGLALERALSARGYKVVITRNTDVYLTLQERTDIANRENADLFVSIHVNALPNKKSMAGFEIYIMALPTDKDAMNLAKVENREYVEGKGMDVANVDRRTEMLLKILGDMQQNNKISESTDFAAALYNAGVINGLPMRRIAQAPFFVLRGAGMPAVLLEIGFVTNAEESQLLSTPVYQQKIANAMAAGIVNYLK